MIFSIYNGKRITNNRLLRGFITGTALIVANCAYGPEAPAPAAWACLATYPVNFWPADLVENGGVVYTVGTIYKGGAPKGGIFSYYAGKLRLEYETPEYVTLWTIGRDLMTRDIFVGGEKYDGAGVVPYLAVNRGGKWEPLDLKGLAGYKVVDALDSAGQGYWFLISELPQEHRAGVLVKYDNGRHITYDSLGTVTTTSLYENGRWTLFALSYEPDKFPPGAPVYLFYSADAGNTWHRQQLPAFIKGRRLVWARCAAARSDGVYFITRLDDPNDGPWAIVRAKRPYGLNYEFVFLSYGSPFFSDLKNISFSPYARQNLGIKADGIAVGDGTSLVYRGGYFYYEKLPYYLTFVSLAPAGSNSPGYVGLARNETYFYAELLFHP